MCNAFILTFYPSIYYSNSLSISLSISLSLQLGKYPVRIFFHVDFKSRSAAAAEAIRQIRKDDLPSLELQLRQAEELLTEVVKEEDFARRQETQLKAAGGECYIYILIIVMLKQNLSRLFILFIFLIAILIHYLHLPLSFFPSLSPSLIYILIRANCGPHRLVQRPVYRGAGAHQSISDSLPEEVLHLQEAAVDY